MNELEEATHKNNIESAMKFHTVAKWAKIILAAFLVATYFWLPDIFIETLTISVVVALLVPLSFFDVFIQKLIEYNTRILEERQRLNAEEANRYFDKAFKKLDRL